MTELREALGDNARLRKALAPFAETLPRVAQLLDSPMASLREEFPTDPTVLVAIRLTAFLDAREALERQFRSS